MTLEWSTKHQAAAQAEGWDIFSTGRDPMDSLTIVDGKPYGFRPFELQGISDSTPMPFCGKDEAAWAHVKAQAQKGDALAIHALNFLKENSIAEYAAIMAHGS